MEWAWRQPQDLKSVDIKVGKQWRCVAMRDALSDVFHYANAL
jgi:hypothetical protein